MINKAKTCITIALLEEDIYNNRANYATPIKGLFLTGAGTHPGGSISGLPGRNCARVFLQTQNSIRERLADAGDAIKSMAQSVFNLRWSLRKSPPTLGIREIFRIVGADLSAISWL